MRCVVASCLMIAGLVAAQPLFAEPSLGDLAGVLDDRNIGYQLETGGQIFVEGFDVRYRVDNGGLVVESTESIEFVSDYAVPVISSFELWKGANLSFDGMEYIANAPNSFRYTLRDGIEWSPPIIDEGAPAGIALARVGEPDRRGLMEFAWLVPEYGGEVPLSVRWTIPKRVAQGFPEPLGFEWKYNNVVTPVPEGYDWYVPRDWQANDSNKWVAPELRYRLSIDKAFLNYYAELATDREKIERVRDLILGSLTSNSIEVVPPAP